MKIPALIALSLVLTACQTFNLDFLKPAAAEEPIEERIPDDPNHAQLYQLMKANRARMKAENPQSKLSHKTIISELLPGEQADIEIELDAGKHYTLFANCTDTCHDLDLALTPSDNLRQTVRRRHQQRHPRAHAALHPDAQRQIPRQHHHGLLPRRQLPIQSANLYQPGWRPGKIGASFTYTLSAQVYVNRPITQSRDSNEMNASRRRRAIIAPAF